MMITGIEKREVKIEVTPEECVKALAKQFNLFTFVYPSDISDDYMVRQIHHGGKLTKLVLLEDISYHGSEDYREVKFIKDTETVTCSHHLNPRF